MSDAETKEHVIIETTASDGGSTTEPIQATPDEIQYLMSLLGYTTETQPDIEDKDFNILLRGVESMSSSEARNLVEEAIEEHQNDRNFPPELYERFKESLEYGEKDSVAENVSADWRIRCCGGIMHYSSPYPEIRAVTHFYDDPDEYVETWRAYFLATLWIAILTFINQFFSVRQPGITFPSSFAQLMIIPCGRFLAKVVPDRRFKIFGHTVVLNPGPWSYKEQSLFLIMTMEAGLPYGDTQILVQKLALYYDNQWAGVGYQLAFMLSTQFLGFGLAGIFRNLLVYPAKNIWMASFPSIATNEALMRSDDGRTVNGWKLSRYWCFGIFLLAIFVYEWFPLYIANFLSYFNWMAWIAPTNFKLNAVTGSVYGLGFNPISTFDWATINSFAPLTIPFFAFTNMMIGAIIGGVVICAVYFSNMYYSAYLPINSNRLFTNTGDIYVVRKVLTDNLLDPEKYQDYSPPYYTASNLVSFGAFFAAYTCIYVSVLLYDYKVMWESVTSLYKSLWGRGKTVHDYKDPHSRMMQKYPETPQWWFLIVLLVALALGIVTFEAFPTNSPVWGIFMTLGLSIVFIVPVSLVYSQTNQMLTINVLTELLVGYALPGNGTALMLIKAFGTNTNIQAVSFMADLKTSCYVKIAPRASFRAQMWATFVVIFVTLGVLQFQLYNIEGICTPALAKTNKFTCPGANTYFSSSIIWGVIGPKRVFDYEYPLLKWCFLIGCFIPLPFYFMRRYLPQTRGVLAYVEPNVILLGLISAYAPLNLSYLLPGYFFNWIFMRVIKKRYTLWFEKYNYVVNAALATGTTICAFIIFWAVQYKTVDLNWWGNTVSYDTLDATLSPWLDLPEAGYFGPAPGEYRL